MKIRTLILGAIALLGAASVNAANWDGTYYGEWNNGLGNATETDLVSGNTISGTYSFSGPYGGQSFVWTGLLTEHEANFGTFTGSGQITGFMFGTSFDTQTNISGYITCDTLGCTLGYSNYQFDIQTVTTLQPPAPVPEPETYGMLLAGLGLIGFAMRRRKSVK